MKNKAENGRKTIKTTPKRRNRGRKRTLETSSRDQLMQYITQWTQERMTAETASGYLMVVTDYCSVGPEVELTPNQKATAKAESLWEKVNFQAIPSHLQSDSMVGMKNCNMNKTLQSCKIEINWCFCVYFYLEHRNMEQQCTFL